MPSNSVSQAEDRCPAADERSRPHNHSQHPRPTSQARYEGAAELEFDAVLLAKQFVNARRVNLAIETRCVSQSLQLGFILPPAGLELGLVDPFSHAAMIAVRLNAKHVLCGRRN